MPSPHQVLGISPPASPDVVRAAWRRAASRWHPDRNPNNPDAAVRFREARMAYEALTDNRAAPEDDMLGSMVADIFAGLFESLVAKSNHHPPPQPRRSNLSWEEVVACHHEGLSPKLTCPRCAGKGAYRVHRTAFTDLPANAKVGTMGNLYSDTLFGQVLMHDRFVMVLAPSSHGGPPVWQVSPRTE